MDMLATTFPDFRACQTNNTFNITGGFMSPFFYNYEKKFMKQQIIDIAKNIGLDKIGFAKAEHLEQEKNITHWIESGYNAGMKYFEKNIERRCNPKLILNEAKTIIVVAQKYRANINYIGKFKIAKFALQEDYHSVILEKLKKISSFLQAHCGAYTREYVDTGAILEKQWAILAGIGWQGKHSLIMNSELGSYFNLGIIITNLEIEPDKIMNNLCKNCRNCVEKCPSNAIVAPFVVDTRKCIAYQTIEMKIDEKIVDYQQNYEKKFIFGCDICQDVCPYNSKFINQKDINVNVETDFINNLTQENFNQTFRNSPLKHIKYNKLMQNIVSSPIFIDN